MGDLENKYPASKYVPKTKLMHKTTAENSLRVAVPSPRGTGRRSLPPVFPRGRVRLHVGYAGKKVFHHRHLILTIRGVDLLGLIRRMTVKSVS